MGREKEFLELIEQHKGILYKVSRMYSNDDESQKDLFQEMLYQLWRAFPSFKKESQFSTWMYRVALNTAITLHKKDQKRAKHVPLKQALSVAPTSEESPKITLFYKAVQQLNQIEKAIIFLYLERHSHREIAKNLGISEVNARVKLNRIKNKLKEIFKTYAHEF